MRRRARSFRGLFLLLLGLVIGLVLPRPWQAAVSPASPSVTPVAVPTERPAAEPTPTPEPTRTPAPASRIVAADAPPQDPWAPVAVTPPTTPKPKAATPKPKNSAAPVRKASTPAPLANREETGMRYVIKRGDTFGSIANRVYGRADMAARLIAANPEINPRALPLGRSIRVPKMERQAAPKPAKISRATPRPLASRQPVAPQPKAAQGRSNAEATKTPVPKRVPPSAQVRELNPARLGGKPSASPGRPTRYQPAPQPSLSPVAPRQPRSAP